jgi:hypothetical protein
MITKEKKIIRFDEAKRIISNTHCNYCEYDEASGDLFNHCPACCEKIVTLLWPLIMME